jgi:hypothetical protein
VTSSTMAGPPSTGNQTSVSAGTPFDADAVTTSAPLLSVAHSAVSMGQVSVRSGVGLPHPSAGPRTIWNVAGGSPGSALDAIKTYTSSRLGEWGYA